MRARFPTVGYVVLQNDTVNIAQAFTTGGNPSGYSLSGLRFGINIDTDADALSWALHADAAGEPAAEPLFAHIAVPSDSLDGDTRTFEDLVHPGFPLAPDTKYWAVLTASPLMEGTGGPTLGAAGISEWGERVILDGPAAELDPGSESGWTLDFSTLSSPHDPLSTEEWVTFTEALELEVNGKMVLRMSVLTHPEVTASFGQESYTVAEGATQSVTVTLSADPERTVTIPIVTMEQDGASSVDYSGVPDSVTFNAGGPTEMTFTFTATQDTFDDEGESVLLGFGSDLSGGVSAGTPDETTLTITDDDPPEVSFGQSAYTVAEGGMVSVEVKLTSAPASAVTVPVTHTPQGATSSADYSGVPASVMFSAGETSKAFTFTATQDTVDDDGESVLLGFGTLPATVQTGTTTESTVNITDDDAAAVSFGQSAYTVAEGGMVSVEVKLTSAPASAVTVPVTHTPQGATSSADYSGVPANVMFSAGETSKAFTFTATQDTVDDDGESVLLGFGTLPPEVSAGTPDETTVSITDDDDPQVSVSFGATSHSVAEGSTVTVRVTLSADPERSVTIPITTMNEEGASDADYSGVPANVVFNSGETEQSITFSATEDAIDDDGESVQLGFGVLPTGVSTGGTATSTVSITDDDVPSVTVSFGSAAYTVAEGGTVEVTVTLDRDPERTVTIPITKANQGTASDADYSGVPANVVFNSGETEQSITFSATEDAIDDDGESVQLGFGVLPTGVSTGTPTETTITITDDDAAAGKVTLELTPATINESGTGNASTVTASIPSASSAATTVTVSVNPADTTTLTGNTTLTIPAGDTNSTGVVTITAVNDDAYTWNRTVAVSGTAVNSVGITDPDDVTLTIREDEDIPLGCESGDIWCGTVAYADRFPSDAAGRKPLRWYHRDHDDQDMLEFSHNEFRYKVYMSSLGANPGGGTYVMPPFHIPERSSSLFGLGTLSATYWEMPNQDYLDWTLYISTNQDGATLEAKLPFNEAKFCCGHKWRWYGLDLYELNYAWAVGKEYQLRIVEDPRADRTPEVLGPPLYLEALGVNRGSVLLRWVRPQVRNDGAPPGVKYKVQWKTAAGMWDTPAVSQHVYVPPSGKEVLSWSIRGLTPGSAYDVRVIAVNEAGDSAPSNVLRVHTDQAFTSSQNQAANSPATGGPGIIGSLLAGETLTATTENIEDEDGLTGAVFAYQWLRSDTDIEGEISSTYTMTDDDAGKAIQVRVTFSDDAGNEESLTSYARLSAPPPPPPPAQQDDDDPAVAVSFGSAAHSVTEGGTVEVTVTLDVDPERTVTVPLTVTVRDGASPADYSGVPASVTFDSGEVLKTFTFSATQDDVDDDGESVKLTFGTPLPARVSAGTGSESTVNIQSKTPLTASVESAPPSHNGSDEFRIRIAFSEEPKTGFSYTTMRAHAFTVTGGSVTGARRLEAPSNIGWEVVVEPDSNGDVTIVLPATTDCNAQGAICTGDGRPLSNRLEITVSGPGG